ncbi:PPE domain-containing protein [Mycobacterium haemophilum]
MVALPWGAVPPEVWSALLNDGPGPGPLLKAAAAWWSLSAEYVAAADTLTAELGAVQAGTWDGPSAGQYVAAHGPYLAWLLESAAKSKTAAALHEEAASGYTAAEASMPTLAELSANRALHKALVATNFFGINTLPITATEARYVSMWLQAAAAMTMYHAVTVAALLAVPATLPAPQIVAPGPQAKPVDVSSRSESDTEGEDEEEEFTCPHCRARANAPQESDLKRPASEVNRGRSPFANALSSALMQILGLPPAPDCPVCAAVDGTMMVGSALQQAMPFAALVAPALAAVPALGVAVAAGIAVPLSVTVPTLTSAPAGAAPPPGTAEVIPAGVGNAALPVGPAAPSGATTIGAGPVGGGPGIGFGPTVNNALGGGAPGMVDSWYAVGLTELSSRSSMRGRTHLKTPEPVPDDADAPDAAAAAARERARGRQRRRARAKDHSHRHEFMDPDAGEGPDVPHAESVGASDRGAGPLGFVGAAAKAGVASAAGLITLGADEWSGGPAVPMLPSSWDSDSPNVGP